MALIALCALLAGLAREVAREIQVRKARAAELARVERGIEFLLEINLRHSMDRDPLFFGEPPSYDELERGAKLTGLKRLRELGHPDPEAVFRRIRSKLTRGVRPWPAGRRPKTWEEIIKGLEDLTKRGDREIDRKAGAGGPAAPRRPGGEAAGGVRRTDGPGRRDPAAPPHESLIAPPLPGA